MSNLPQRGIHITTANGVIVIPENSTAEEIANAIKGNIQVPEPRNYKISPAIFEPLTAVVNEPNKIVRGKSHHKKHHKPNTGLKLGSYKYKSR